MMQPAQLGQQQVQVQSQIIQQPLTLQQQPLTLSSLTFQQPTVDPSAASSQTAEAVGGNSTPGVLKVDNGECPGVFFVLKISIAFWCFKTRLDG